MYTNVRNVCSELESKASPSLSGLLNHTALAGHAVLVGQGQHLHRLAPVLRAERMMVSIVTAFSDIEPCMLVGQKTMLVLDVCDDQQHRRAATIARTYPNILCVSLVCSAQTPPVLEYNRCTVGRESQSVAEHVIETWRAWIDNDDNLLEAWLGALERLVPCYANMGSSELDLMAVSNLIGLEALHVLGTEDDASWTRSTHARPQPIDLRPSAFGIATSTVISEENIAAYISSPRNLGMKSVLLMPVETQHESRGYLLAIAAKDFCWTAEKCAQLSVVGQARAYRDLHPDGESLDVIVELLVHILSGKDGYTAQHSDRVAILAREIALELNLPDSSVQLSYLGGRLHDIGKLWVDDHFLTKAGPLTPSEYEALKLHTTAGYELLDRFERLRVLKNVVLCHHERMDGFGYPQGLSGESIPLIARIVSVADAYDAMTTDRSYRRGRPSAEALGELNRCAGKQFDATIVNAFNHVFERLESPTWHHSL